MIKSKHKDKNNKRKLCIVDWMYIVFIILGTILAAAGIAYIVYVMVV